MNNNWGHSGILGLLLLAGACGGRGDADGSASSNGGAHGDGAGPTAPAPVVEARRAASVAILREHGGVIVGAATPMRGLVRNGSGRLLGGKAMSWTTEDPAIATVDASTGVVVGRAPGKTTVSVAVDGVTDKIEIDVERSWVTPTYVGVTTNCLLTRAGRIYCRRFRGEAPGTEFTPVAEGKRFKKIAHNPYSYVQDAIPLLAIGEDGHISGVGISGFVSPDQTFVDVMFHPRGEFAYALSTNGQVYVLGMPWAVGAISKSSIRPGATRFVKVSLGMHHALGIGTDGQTYSWYESGAPFVPDKHDCTENEASYRAHLPELGVPVAGLRCDAAIPARIDTGGRMFVSVAAADHVSLGLTADGTAYSWGGMLEGDRTYYGARGRRPGDDLTPRPLETATKFAQLGLFGRKMLYSTGWSTSAGMAWGFGQRAEGGMEFWSPTDADDVTRGLESALPFAAEFPLFSSFVGAGFYLGGMERATVVTADDRIGYVDVSSSYREQKATFVEETDTNVVFAGIPHFELDGKNLVERVMQPGSTEELSWQAFRDATKPGGSGFRFPAEEYKLVLLDLERASSPPYDLVLDDSSGRLDLDGVVYEMDTSVLGPGQAGLTVKVTATPTAKPGRHNAFIYAMTAAQITQFRSDRLAFFRTPFGAGLIRIDIPEPVPPPTVQPTPGGSTILGSCSDANACLEAHDGDGAAFRAQCQGESGSTFSTAGCSDKGGPTCVGAHWTAKGARVSGNVYWKTNFCAASGETIDTRTTCRADLGGTPTGRHCRD